MMVSQQIALWADKLRDVAAWGLRNSKIVQDNLPADEVMEVQWFLEKNLPTEISPGHDLQIPVAFRAWHTQQPAFFDGIVSDA